MKSPLTVIKDERPWGYFERFTQGEQTTVKLLCVQAGQAFSLQTHKKRDEYWRILRGEGTVTVGDARTPGKAGDSFYVPRGTAHRVEAGEKDVLILELAFGDFDENDIIRLEDRYGRT